MALAVNAVLTGVNNGQDVHPFFSSARNTTMNLTQDDLFSHQDESATVDRRIKSAQRTMKAKAEKRLSKSKQLSLTTSRYTDSGIHPDSRTRLGDVTLQKPSSIHYNNGKLRSHNLSDDLDIDLNLDRRKRQRILPPQSQKPDVEGNLEDQISAEASNDGYDETLQKRDESGATEISTGLTQSMEKGTADGYNRVMTAIEKQDTVPINPTSGAEPFPIQKRGRPKKLLKLSSDGKLDPIYSVPGDRLKISTEKPRISPRKEKTAGKKQAVIRKGAISTKVLILKYGFDEESRQATANKINNICSRHVNKAKTFPDNSEPPCTKSALHEQSKPTHPFFLGKLIQQTGNVVSVGDEPSKIPVHNDSCSSGDQDVQPSKKASVMSEANTELWAKLGGLGAQQRNGSRTPRFPGTKEPLWPPRDMMHCRGLPTDSGKSTPDACLPNQQRKFKSAEVQIPENESVLRPYNQTVCLCRKESDLHTGDSKILAHLRRPQRRIMTSLELQEAIRERVESRLTITKKSAEMMGPIDDEFDNLVNHAQGKSTTHHALLHVYDRITTSCTAFDTFQCEIQEWVHKYAPRCAADVLQQGREIILLRDWLKNLTVSSVENGIKDPSRPRESLLSLKRSSLKVKRKRKRQEELTGFIVSSDEEANEMDELTEPDDPTSPKENSSLIKRSIIRAGEAVGLSKAPGDPTRNTNAVVISGPHGCGKTAAVYAVAQELGFEVFEINSGSRRSGKDLLDKVGDMTRNHLVHRAQGVDGSNVAIGEQDSAKEHEINVGHQSTIKTFLEPSNKIKGQSKPSKSPKARQPDRTKSQHHRKQSLILLEEVDILFEEDKQFWTTALTLIFQSKRPIVMTCTNEAQVPLDQMALHAIFRLTSAPIHIATDYLLLVAANEGHLLTRSSISSLYKGKHADLRASIADLNFWCQMAIGDTKGGLEWMPIPSPSSKYVNSQDERQRVVSEDSYVEGMGLLRNTNPLSDDTSSTSDDLELLIAASHGWDIDIEKWHWLMDNRASINATDQMTKEELTKTLALQDEAADAMSVADVYPCLGLRRDEKTTLDTTLPRLTENTSNNYVESFHLLQADPLEDPTGLSMSLPLALQACARRLLSLETSERKSCSLNEETVNRCIVQRMQDSIPSPPVTRDSISLAFEPLMEPLKGPFLQSRGPGITTFDGSLSTVVEDTAPYVRTIVSYDLQLEEQRLRLSNLLSEGGRNGKRQRTTRASRAALEGGSKAHTRRERWFPSHTNFSLVLQTGGSGWQEALWQVLASNRGDLDASHTGSRRSSMGTISSEG